MIYVCSSGHCAPALNQHNHTTSVSWSLLLSTSAPALLFPHLFSLSLFLLTLFLSPSPVHAPRRPSSSRHRVHAHLLTLTLTHKHRTHIHNCAADLILQPHQSLC